MNEQTQFQEVQRVYMTYSEMTAKFRAVESKGDHLTGYIIFTPDSFLDPYSEKSRTYCVSSNNKAYIAGMGGYSIVVICLVVLLVSSVFGIFFSSEDTGSAQTMQDVVGEINGDYRAQIETNKANIDYDILEMSGSRAVWPDVLAVYAVKTTSDPDNPQEVATMKDSKKAILKDIFWQMNTISTRAETREETVIEETDDGEGNIVETETVVTRTVLYITVSHKTADEMASHLGFNQTQKDQLAELLVPENRQMWAAVLYGIGTADDQIVLVAKSQVGNVGGNPNPKPGNGRPG